MGTCEKSLVPTRQIQSLQVPLLLFLQWLEELLVSAKRLQKFCKKGIFTPQKRMQSIDWEPDFALFLHLFLQTTTNYISES